MRKILFLVVASLLAILLLPAAPAESAGGRYVAGPGGASVWCSADPHPLVPVGDPDDYDPLGWLLSGAPECAPSDALNAASEATGGSRQATGIGGFVFFLPAGTSQILLSAQEDIGGAPPLSTPNGDYCSLAVLESFAPLASPSMYWVQIGSVHVTDELNVCAGTTGTIFGSW